MQRYFFAERFKSTLCPWVIYRKTSQAELCLDISQPYFTERGFFLKKTQVASPFTQSGGSCSSPIKNLTWSIRLFYSSYFLSVAWVMRFIHGALNCYDFLKEFLKLFAITSLKQSLPVISELTFSFTPVTKKTVYVVH